MRANVIICNYNYEKYIKDAIDSALNQSYKNLQVTIIDDCSTDNSVNIVEDYLFKGESHDRQETDDFVVKTVKRNDISIAFIKLKKNSGPSFARNIGIQLTHQSTDVFFILDADDIYYPDKVARCLYEINKAPEVIGVVYTDYDILNIKTGITARTYKPVYSREHLLKECIVHSGAAITKKAILATAEQTGFYDNRIKGPEDYDLWLRISEKFLIGHVAESHSLVRITGQNISSNSHSEFNKNYENGFNIIRQKVASRNANKRN